MESFESTLLQKESELATLKSQSKKFAWIRLLFFSIGPIAIYYYLSTELFVVLVGGILSFLAFLITTHFDQSHQKKKIICEQIIHINKDEIAIAKGDLSSLDAGVQFIDKNHLFSQDLDFFGEGSLFQHINRTVLSSSKQLLSNFLLQTVTIAEVQARRKAIEEITGKRPWRQTFQANLSTLNQVKNGDSTIEMLKNLGGGNTHHRGEFYLAFIFGLFTIFTVALHITGAVPLGFLLLLLLVNLTIIAIYNAGLQSKTLKTNTLQQSLQTLFSTIKTIQQENFSSSLLQKKHVILNDAARQIQKLNQLVFLLDSRANFLWPLVNAFLLIDLYTGWFLKKWLKQNQPHLIEWIAAINLFEVFSSFGAFREQHPEFTWPVLSEVPKWEAKNVGHPLISLEQRIVNDFRISKPLSLITGSNMSGKSTFLRTVGLNTQLAWIGLPVCASELTVSRFQLFSSMRVNDDLTNHTSSFYAELKRIQLLFQVIEKSNTPVLFLLDEILRGTNSADRHDGSKGIIEKLMRTDAEGFISTHDLMLADEYLEDKSVSNYSFSSELVENELVFDYKIKAGKSTNTNASTLMRKLGIIDP